jgi:uncharacterized protein YjbJ (UPF0337 family)
VVFCLTVVLGFVPKHSIASKKWEDSMNWDQIEGKWKQASGKIREKWGKLTDDDLTVINGRRDQLVGRIQERYGLAKEAAEKQVDEFVRSYNAALDDTPEENRQSRERAHGAGKR